MKYYKTSAAKSKYKAQLVFITVSEYPSNELKRGYSAKLVSSGMWQGLRAAGCHVWAGKGPTVCVSVCVCWLQPDLWPKWEQAGCPDQVQLCCWGLGDLSMVTVEWRKKEREKKKVGEEAGRERKQRKREAGSSTVVCGHSLHGLLNKERTW